MKRFPWLSRRKKTDPELPYETPLWFGPRSNGEAWLPATKRDRLIRKVALEKAAENADRLGMDRRQFLASSMGMATTLWAINYVTACSSDSAANGGPDGGGGGGGGSGGKGGLDGGGGSGGGSMADADARYCMPPEAMFEKECADGVVGGNEFIFDVQTHWFKEEDLANYSAYLNAFGALFKVATEDNYIRNIFCDSDTTVACLTAWPGVTCTSSRRVQCGLPLSNDSIVASRERINGLMGNTQRVLNHCQILPQDTSGIETQLEIMEEFHCTYGIAAWKLYPGFKPGFRLNQPEAEMVIERGLKLGINRFCIHKGLPIGNFFDVNTNYPDDVGPAAVKYPEARLIIYHSGICSGTDVCGSVTEGPYDPDDPMPKGVNALIRSILDAGLEPGANVYGETGTAFNNLRNDPVQAAHFFGKLMKYLGEDNVCWGTDSIINGGPQPQIETFRALEIPQSMQEEYGYPALTAERKAKILGLNSAKLYGVDVDAARCVSETCPTAQIRRELDEEMGPRRWTFNPPNGPKTFEEFLEGAEEMRKLGRPG